MKTDKPPSKGFPMDRLEMLIVLKRMRDAHFIPNWKRNGYTSKEAVMEAITKAIGIDR